MNINDVTYICNFCQSEGSLSKVFTYLTSKKEPISIFQCSECLCFIPDFYQTSHWTTREAIRDQVKFHDCWWSNEQSEDLISLLSSMKEMLGHYHNYIDPEKNRIIEIGAGRGALLAALKESGYAAIGCEPSSFLCSIGKSKYELDEQTLYQESVQDFIQRIASGHPIFLGKKPDRVFLWHVLEHLDKPLEMLDKLLKVCSDDVKLLIQLPLLNQNYIYPEHYFFVSTNTLSYISNKFDLDIEFCTLDPTFFFITAVLAKNSHNSCIQNSGHITSTSIMTPLSELIILKDDLIKIKDEIITGQKLLIEERWSIMQDMGQQINQAKNLNSQQNQQMENMKKQIEHSVKSGSSRFERSISFKKNSHNRYWWHQIPDCSYAPPIYSFLEENDWKIIESWYLETENSYLIGETTIPFISLVHGLVMGNGIQRIVQAGHYAGYSCLLIGFMMKYMKAEKSLFSIDIDAEVSAFTQNWLDKACLNEYVYLHVGNSASDHSCQLSLSYLGSPPEMVIIDSSHQYAHTVDELNLWYSILEPGGFIVMHDSSQFAASFDSTNMGGVHKAIKEWRKNNPSSEVLTINSCNVSTPPSSLIYKDGCGVVLIHKPLDQEND